ncbi:hypothetical protein RYA05_00890 [Pseudomonas syringae pv. actinidiae]|nr:hypothetical protein [Pseudomonas syringae pv. actinidiae]
MNVLPMKPTAMVLPVIHHLDRVTSLDQAELVKECGAEGLFLISHHGQDLEIAQVASEIKKLHPDMKVGLNFLSLGALEATRACITNNLDMIWGDDCAVDSTGYGSLAVQIREAVSAHPAIEVFASVAFKYRAPEPDPLKAARNALSLGFIPTTSGSGTGSAPTLEKIQHMSGEAEGRLAVASGMTPDNITEFAPLLSHILVATGVSTDEHHFDFEALSRFIALVRNAG